MASCYLLVAVCQSTINYQFAICLYFFIAKTNLGTFEVNESYEFLITFVNRGLTETPLTIEADFYQQLS